MTIGAPYQRFFKHAAPAISPDGMTLAFWAPDADNRVKLWVRDFRSPQPPVLPNTTIREWADNHIKV